MVPRRWTALSAGLLGLGLLLTGLAMALPARPAAADTVPAVAAHPWRAEAAVVFDRLGREDGLPHAVVTAMVRDSDSFFWVGTQGGLVRFDGYAFTAAPGAMGSTYVRALMSLPGQLWIGSNADGLAVLDIHAASLRRWSVGDGLAADRVNALAVADGGGLWVGTQAGLQRLDTADGRLTTIALATAGGEGRGTERVAALLPGRAGSLWIGTGGGLLRRDADGRLRTGPDGEQAEGWPDGPVLSLEADGAGRIWVGTANGGLWLLDGDGRVLRRWGAGQDGLPHPRVTSVVDVGNGQVWAGTYGGGLVVIEGDDPPRIVRHDAAVASSLSGDAVTKLYRDPSGLVWVGTAGAGLNRHNPANAAILTLPYSPTGDDGPSHANVLSLLAARDGRLWVGTAGNGVDVLVPGGRVEALRPGGASGTAGLRDGAILALAEAEAADGSIWIGTQRGLYRRPAGPPGTPPVPVDGPPELHEAQIYAVRPLPDGTVWAAGGRGAFRIAPDGTVTRWDGTTGLSAAEVNAILPDRQGRIWLATDGGLDRLDPVTGRIEQAPLGIDRKVPLVSTLLQDRAGRIWAGTLGRGLAVSVPAGAAMPTFRRLRREDGLPSENIGALAEDAAGRIWISTDAGLAVIDPATLGVRTLGAGDGVVLREYWLNAVAVARDGTLAFGGSGGITLVRPHALQGWTYPAPVRLTDLIVGGRRLPAAPYNREGAGPLVIRPEDRSITVEFTGLDLARPASNRYAVRLNGFEAAWSERDSTRRTATWTSLPPGLYTLEIRAANKNGHWSDAVFRLPVRVLPAWWQQGWVRLAAAIAVIAAAYGAYRARTGYLHARQQELEVLVADRTAELARQKEELERALDDLRAAQDEIVRSEKLAALGRLVAGVAHEINTPVGLVVTSSSQMDEEVRLLAAKLAGRSLRRSELEEFLALAGDLTTALTRSAERAADLISSFKQVSADQTSEERRTIDLTDYVQEVAKTIRPALRTAGVELSVTGPAGLAVTTFPGLLAQVLTNLATNAAAHAYAGQPCPQLRIEVEARSRGGARIVVADNGNGMPPEVRDRAFEPFFTTNRAGGGTGLGLHIVHNLVTGPLGGRITLVTAPGEGARFQITLPAAPLPAAPQ